MDREARRLAKIRSLAERLWELDGRPEGRAEVHWRQAEAIEAAQSAQAQHIVYVLDQDLVRFLKFAAGIIAVLITGGAILWGVDLKQMNKEIETVRKAMEADRKTTADVLNEVRKLQNDTTEAVRSSRVEIDNAVAQARRNVQEIVDNVTEARKYVTAQGIVVDTLKLEIRQEVERQVGDRTTVVVGAEAASTSLPASKPPQYKPDQVLALLRSDVEKARAYLKRYGLDLPSVEVEIHKDPGFQNSYYSERKVTFGMGMVNGPIFGPYDPTLVWHEVGHTLFDILFSGESGSVAESICDVLAVLIEGRRWTLGSVRTGVAGTTQALRSLSAPGTAYDDPVIGKDRQPDHMSAFATVGGVGGGIQINSGILNKAAYLMSEGGSHRGVTVSKGFGREKLAQLYAGVVKALPKGQAVDFRAFKALTIATAGRLFSDQADRTTVAQSFAAVGL